MARVSKYQGLVGQTFNIKGLEVKVVRYHKEPRTSKSGRKYSAYRLDIQLKDFQDILEISTVSWKKQSFIKRLVKTSVNPSKPVVYSCLPVVYNPIQKDFLGKTLQECWDRVLEESNHLMSVKEVHQWFKKYIKFYHPDMLGRKQTFDEEICFNTLVEIRDSSIHMIREMEEAFGIKLA